MDTGTRDMNRRVERLCPRHRAALRWASLRDRLPSELAEKSARYRVEVLDRALTCAGCRARNEPGRRASAAPSGSGPMWNSTTVTKDAAVTWAARPGSGGYGDRHAKSGRSLHLGWVIAGVSTLAVTVSLAGLGVMSRSEVPASDTRPPAGQTGERPADAADPEGTGRLVDYPDLRVGDCVRDMDSEENLDLEVVSCETPHTDEVVGTFKLSRQRWPGQKRVDQLAERGCRPRFEKYVGVPVADSSLDWFSDSPVKIGWPEDRSVVCTAANRSGASTGSVRGTGR